MTREMLMKEPPKDNGEAEEEVKRPNRGTNPSTSYTRRVRQMRRGNRK